MVAQKQDTPITLDCKVECRESQISACGTHISAVGTRTFQMLFFRVVRCL